MVLPSQGPLITPSPDMVRAQSETLYSAATRISTTEAVEASLVITIPVHWNSYDIFVWVSFSSFEDRTSGSNDTLVFKIRKTGLGGDQWGKLVQEIGTAPPDTNPGAGFLGFSEAETTTGAVTVALTAKASTNDLDYAMDDIVMMVQAYRVT